jgi:hypothetical protein
MIRGAVLHFASEQPLVGDMRALPTAADVCIVITNLRFVDGRRPTFIDHADSWFLYPLNQIRFIEIPADSFAGEEHLALPEGDLVTTPLTDDEDEEIYDPAEERAADELLRRIREA